MKRYVKILLAAALLAITALAMPLSASAEKTVVSDKYTFIGNPSYIFCSDGEILILGNDKLLVYSYDYRLAASYDLPGAVKIEKNELHTVYSTKDGVYSLSDDGASETLYSGAVTDFCLAGDRWYYAIGDTVACRSFSDGQSFVIECEADVTSLAYAGGKVYLSAKGDSFGYSDIYVLEEEKASLAYDYCKNLSYLLGGDSLCYYGAGKAVNPETGAAVSFTGEESRVASSREGFYFVTAGGELYLADGQSVTLIFACTSSDKGYFAFPRGAASDYGKLFILDYANDRVAVMEDDIAYIPVKRPTAITADYAGNLYIAGKEGLFVIDVNTLTGLAPVSYSGGSINSITYSEGALYYTSEGKAYRLEDGESVYVCDALAVRSEYFGGKLYFLRSDGIYKADYSYPSVSTQGAVDFDVAADGSIYVLKDGKITQYTDAGDLVAEYPAEEGAAAICVSLVTNNYTDFGDIVVTCPDMHKVYNVKLSQTSSLPSADLQYTDTDGIIRTALENAYIYSYPCSVSKVAAVPAGATLIVGKYDLYETERMSYVLYEDFSGLKTGYIYKGLLSEPFAESAPSESSGRTLYDNTALYRFPTSRGDALVDNIGKNVAVTILPFTDYSYDGVQWLKVRCNGNTGFVAKDMISTGQYIPTDERPQYNASLTKDAQIYDKINDVFVPTGYTLPSGSDVEIIGVFDQGSEYTHIKYFDDRLGLREGYVPTSALTSYSITPLQIIGLCCAGIIALLLISVCIIKFAGKRKRQLNRRRP